LNTTSLNAFRSRCDAGGYSVHALPAPEYDLGFAQYLIDLLKRPALEVR